MRPVRTACATARWLFAVLFALLLALRVVSPAGFMPAFDRGTVTIIACPDAMYEPASMAMHNKGHSNHHEQCPYASASSLGALGVDFTALIASSMFAVALLLGRTFLFIERHSRQLRPPLRGPPLTA